MGHAEAAFVSVMLGLCTTAHSRSRFICLDTAAGTDVSADAWPSSQSGCPGLGSVQDNRYPVTHRQARQLASR